MEQCTLDVNEIRTVRQVGGGLYGVRPLIFNYLKIFIFVTFL